MLAIYRVVFPGGSKDTPILTVVEAVELIFLLDRAQAFP